MFYEKKSGLFLPGASRHNVEVDFVERTARRIADSVMEKHRTGIRMDKAINIMMNQVDKVARKQKGKQGKARVERIKMRIAQILKEEG